MRALTRNGMFRVARRGERMCRGSEVVVALGGRARPSRNPTQAAAVAPVRGGYLDLPACLKLRRGGAQADEMGGAGARPWARTATPTP